MSLDFEVTESAGAPVEQAESGEEGISGPSSSEGTALDVPGPAGPYGLGQVDRQPSAVTRPAPTYPYEARSRGIEGEVQVSFTVTDRGEVEDVRILRASPPDIFREAVKRGVSRWQFEPATKGGRPVAVRVTTTVRFKLE